MRRRDFLAGAAWGPYSLVVLAQNPPAGTAGRPAEENIRAAISDSSSPDRTSPPDPSEPNMRLVDLDCDVLVAGGGLAGVCAALAAARNGARVILVQDRSRLGGNSSSEVKMHVVGANAHKARPGWREGGILEELRLQDAARNPQRCWELWDLLLYDKVIGEKNIRLLLDSTLYRAAMSGNRIRSVLVRCDRSEHLYRIAATIFIDCTGDSRLGLEAGAEMRHGREARSEFGEDLAPEQPDRETMGSSILFTSREHDRPMPFVAPPWARKVTREQLRFRPTNSWEYGYWWIEWGGQIDTVRSHERIRFELLAIALGVWDYIKNSGDHPDSANWAMDWIGMIPGKRESRRIVGDYILKQDDLLRGDFEDAVAIGGWPMDDHPPGGFDRADLPPARQILTPEVYNIPLRCLYSRNIRNLMMAGRNISASHVAFSSTRVMGTCAVVGQAAGTASALCIRHGLLPRDLYEKKTALRELQQLLLRDDQTIRGLANQDPEDLARGAAVRASREEQDAPAANVIDGLVRNVPGGPKHCWEAELRPEGAWVELSWPKPQRLSRVQIMFNSGFERELTLSSSRAANRGIIRDVQPELVKDYAVLGRSPGARDFKMLTEVRGNFQRLNRISFDPAELEAVRVHVTSTNGYSRASIFEIRCY
ncbi:MAG: FAD-dependent oxidoreductase [Acidobacteria bacterium]|nr:FAD-dependent oxidoreductase [Acidobacteriota bacterium]